MFSADERELAKIIPFIPQSHVSEARKLLPLEPVDQMLFSPI